MAPSVCKNVCRLVEHHLEERQDHVVFGRLGGGAIAERPDLVRHELLPAEAGRVAPPAPLQPAMEGVSASTWTAIARSPDSDLAFHPVSPPYARNNSRRTRFLHQPCRSVCNPKPAA
jgi:hypothetical protein